MACIITYNHSAMRYAAALWMQKFCSKPMSRKNALLTSISEFFGRSVSTTSAESSGGNGVVKIKGECWFAFLECFSVQWIDDFGDDPHLDAYRMRHSNSLAEEKSHQTFENVCDRGLYERLYYLRENVVLCLVI